MAYKLNSPSQAVQDVAHRVLSDASLTTASSSKDKAVAMFNFVRDNIRFGFTSRFDHATPDYTLQAKRGHCNPQGSLFASLCNAVGVPATQRFVVIENDVLRGVLDGFTPDKLLHSYVQLDIDGTRRNVDGYIASRPLFDAASAKLREEGRQFGYGVSLSGSVDWDGSSDCFVQMTTKPIRDLCAYIAPLDIIDSELNFQTIPTLGRLFFGFGTVLFNRRIDAVEREASTS